MSGHGWTSNPWVWAVTFRLATDERPEVKHRPILFQAPMVRAILDGRKTQTRRPVKARHDWHVDEVPDRAGVFRPWPVFEAYVYAEPNTVEVPCPYGQLGDRLWVRETWAPTLSPSLVNGAPRSMAEVDTHTQYRGYPRATYRADLGAAAGGGDGRWRPSIYMPRWASRLTLEVVDVRVQRLQELDEHDALAEGTQGWALDPRCETARDGFRYLWDFIHGTRGKRRAA